MAKGDHHEEDCVGGRGGVGLAITGPRGPASAATDTYRLTFDSVSQPEYDLELGKPSSTYTGVDKVLSQATDRARCVDCAQQHQDDVDLGL